MLGRHLGPASALVDAAPGGKVWAYLDRPSLAVELATGAAALSITQVGQPGGPLTRDEDGEIVSGPPVTEERVQPKLGLALSGGGHRAAFFHVGVLAKLAELGLLRPIQVISTLKTSFSRFFLSRVSGSRTR